jgi:Ca2+-transporting ATPase
MSTAWHTKELEQVLAELKVSPEGLDEKEAKQRLEEYGYNELVEKKKVTPLEIFLGQFKDIFVIMLLIATAISFAIGETVDALVIAVIVLLNAIVGFVQEYRSEKAMEAMKKLTAPKARVLRGGNELIVPAREIVPGDIVLFEAGDRVPADARLLEVVDLKADEAILTGESAAISKDLSPVAKKASIGDRKNSVFMATHMTYGRGKAVVTSTGMNTEFGKIAEMVQTMEVEESPLKQKLEKFAKKLGIIIVIVSAIIFALALYEVFVLGITHGADPITNILESFETAIALAVSAVPEGLPAIVTASLALGASKLAKKNAIIRRLSSAETLGATTVICSDKTGTLTRGEMTVRKIFVNSKVIDVSGAGYESKGEFKEKGKTIIASNQKELKLLLETGTLCSTANYDGKKIIGDTTEGALIVVAAKAGIIKKKLESQKPKVHEIPFTSERKIMTTVHKNSENKFIAYTKGAPEIVLSNCREIFENGKIRKLSKQDEEVILENNEKMASSALRVLGLAFKNIPNTNLENISKETTEENLVFLGLTGMIDPPRDEAKEANLKCRKAGIRTIMITGDHKLTAVAIAKELEMIQNDKVLTGAELDKLSEVEFDNAIENVSVYARVSPEHKLRIVKTLKKKGEIVAMTGDGVNDAPALKQADIGVAMGITGTDVTREAADMVLADDNFATIVTAVEGGRGIYDNIRKFSFFLLRSNFDELGIIGLFALMGLELPLTAGMILWLNLATDGGPALALTMDPPEDAIMDRPPRNPNEGVLHGRFASIIATFTLQFLLTGGIFYWQYYLTGAYLLPEPARIDALNYARTMAFMRATLQELLIVWNCRSERKNAFRVGFLSNKYLILAVIISAIITLALPFVGLFDTVPITNLTDWLIISLASISGLFILPEIFYGRKIWKWR